MHLNGSQEFCLVANTLIYSNGSAVDYSPASDLQEDYYSYDQVIVCQSVTICNNLEVGLNEEDCTKGVEQYEDEKYRLSLLETIALVTSFAFVQKYPMSLIGIGIGVLAYTAAPAIEGFIGKNTIYSFSMEVISSTVTSVMYHDLQDVINFFPNQNSNIYRVYLKTTPILAGVFMQYVAICGYNAFNKYYASIMDFDEVALPRINEKLELEGFIGISIKHSMTELLKQSFRLGGYTAHFFGTMFKYLFYTGYDCLLESVSKPSNCDLKKVLPSISIYSVASSTVRLLKKQYESHVLGDLAEVDPNSISLQGYAVFYALDKVIVKKIAKIAFNYYSSFYKTEVKTSQCIKEKPTQVAHRKMQYDLFWQELRYLQPFCFIDEAKSEEA